MPAPIVLIFGPAGGGKTTLADALEAKLGLWHVNFDPPYSAQKGFSNGPEILGLSAEFNAFCNGRPELLASKVREQTAARGAAGVCISWQSFYGLQSFRREYLDSLLRLDIRYLLLVAPEDECYRSFFERNDDLTAQQKNRESWSKTNRFWFHQLDQQTFAGHTISMFDGSSRRTRESLVTEVAGSLGLQPIAPEK